MANMSGTRHTMGTAKTEGSPDAPSAAHAATSGSKHTSESGDAHPQYKMAPSAPANTYHPNGEHEATNAVYEC